MFRSIWGYCNYGKLFLTKDLFCFVHDAECVSCRYQTVLSGDDITQIRESARAPSKHRGVVGHVRPQHAARYDIKWLWKLCCKWWRFHFPSTCGPELVHGDPNYCKTL